MLFNRFNGICQLRKKMTSKKVRAKVGVSLLILAAVWGWNSLVNAGDLNLNNKAERPDIQNEIAFRQSVEDAKSYLSSTDNQQSKLLKRLANYHGPIEPVIKACQRPRLKVPEKIPNEHFILPHLKEKYPDDLLFYYVPPLYDNQKQFGLLIFMHGGNRATPQARAVEVILPREEPHSYGLHDFITDIPFITVSPSAPWKAANDPNHKDDNNARWNVAQADDYIASVIEESQHRFNIDPHRIILAGQSMGAFGAYHLCQRLNDRIAGAILCAGAWKKANFSCFAGTSVYIFHGLYDSAPGYSNVKTLPARPQNWTGVSFARAAHQLMTDYGIENVYNEFPGGHLIEKSGPEPGKFIQWMLPLKRDPYYKKVVAISPRGSWLTDFLLVQPSPHSRWVTINKTDSGNIDYDKIVLTGPRVAENMQQFQQQGYKLEKIPMPGGRVEAVLKKNNVIECQTENVLSFSLWLHPQMVVFDKPIIVIVNGNKKNYSVKASLIDALRSYQRRKDWGLIYHAEIVIDLTE